jgi:hypothetical protein
MGSIHPMEGGERGQAMERAALRRGLAVVGSPGQALRLARNPLVRTTRCCANCAGSLEHGAVLSGGQAYCSLECSLWGRPA